MEAVRITRCEPGESLAAASAVFDAYRQHYRQPAEPERALAWLTGAAASGALTVFTAASGEAASGLYERVGFRPVEGLVSLSPGLR